MNSQQIYKIIKPILNDKFLGVYPSNGIPSIKRYPVGIVVNTDPIGSRGKHWQAIWIVNNQICEFFDSYGNEPKGEIKEFTSRFNQLKVNRIKLQSNFEISCGPFVIYFIIKRALGKPFDSIVAMLKNKGYFSDAYAKFYVNELIKKQKTIKAN